MNWNDIKPGQTIEVSREESQAGWSASQRYQGVVEKVAPSGKHVYFKGLGAVFLGDNDTNELVTIKLIKDVEFEEGWYLVNINDADRVYYTKDGNWSSNPKSNFYSPNDYFGDDWQNLTITRLAPVSS